MATRIRLKRREHLFASICAIALLGGCTNDGEPARPASPQGSLVTITIADNSFSPANLAVTGGFPVTWAWAGKNAHSVMGVWNGALVASQQQQAGTFTFVFATTGTFEYQCGVHGAAMSGRVTIK